MIDAYEYAEECVDAIERHMRIPDLFDRHRGKRIAGGRHVAWYLIRKHTDLSYPEIAQYFNKGDHTTILHGVRRVESDERLMSYANAIERKVNAH